LIDCVIQRNFSPVKWYGVQVTIAVSRAVNQASHWAG